MKIDLVKKNWLFLSICGASLFFSLGLSFCFYIL